MRRSRGCRRNVVANIKGPSTSTGGASSPAAQRSASQVLKGRRGGGPELAETTGARLFALQAASVRAGTDLMVVDTPAVVEDEVSHAIVAADLCRSGLGEHDRLFPGVVLVGGVDEIRE